MGVADTFGHEQMVGHQQRKEDPKTDQDHAHSQKMVKSRLNNAVPERIYNSHYGNGVPAMFTS